MLAFEFIAWGKNKIMALVSGSRGRMTSSGLESVYVMRMSKQIKQRRRKKFYILSVELKIISWVN